MGHGATAGALQRQHQALASRARAAGHHAVLRVALAARQHQVAVIDGAAQHAHFARAAQTFAAVALHVDVGAFQRRQNGLVGAHLQGDARVLQLDFKGALLGWVKRRRLGLEVLDAQRIVGPVRGAGLQRRQHALGAAGVDAGVGLRRGQQGNQIGALAFGHLPARGIADGNVVDWLPWWDNALLLALRPHLPEGLLLVAVRDPRDMLLDWLASGSPVPLALESPEAAAEWLAQGLEQVADLHQQDLYPHRLLRLDGAIDSPPQLATVIGQALDIQLPPLPATQRRMPPGRWRDYADELAGPFERLAPVAARLGYPDA